MEFSLSVFTVDSIVNRVPVDEYKNGKHIKIFQKQFLKNLGKILNHMLSADGSRSTFYFEVQFFLLRTFSIHTIFPTL